MSPTVRVPDGRIAGNVMPPTAVIELLSPPLMLPVRLAEPPAHLACGEQSARARSAYQAGGLLPVATANERSVVPGGPLTPLAVRLLKPLRLTLAAPPAERLRRAR